MTATRGTAAWDSADTCRMSGSSSVGSAPGLDWGWPLLPSPGGQPARPVRQAVRPPDPLQAGSRLASPPRGRECRMGVVVDNVWPGPAPRNGMQTGPIPAPREPPHETNRAFGNDGRDVERGRPAGPAAASPSRSVRYRGRRGCILATLRRAKRPSASCHPSANTRQGARELSIAMP
jgi:hypothetical protein